MKSVYTFYFDERKTFLCDIDCDDMTMYLQQKDAIHNLKSIDKMHFDQVKMFSNSIRLYNETNEIIIKNLDLFIKNNMNRFIPNLFERIEKASKMYLKEEAKKKTKKNKKRGTVKVTAALITASFIATGVTSLAKQNDNQMDVNEVKVSYLDEMNLTPTNTQIEPVVDEKEENSTYDEVVQTIEPENIINNTNYETTDFVDSNENTHAIYLDFQLTDDLEKKNYAFQEFEAVANEYGEKWGVEPNAILWILTQESAGKGDNLMKIEWDVWSKEPITAYNFRDGVYQTIMLTNHPEKYADKNYVCITEEDLKNPKTNISVGCMILRKSAEYMHYHVPAALQCYNFGKGNMDTVFAETYKKTGQTKEDILSDQTNISFYNYTYVVKEGDPLYLSHIFSFMDNYGDTVRFKHLKNGEVVEEVIQIFNQSQRL